MSTTIPASTAARTDQRSLKFLIQQMNRALRDSHGGGIMERFEDISKLLFTKIVDEREVEGRWDGSPAKPQPEFERRPGELDRVVFERVRSIWHRAIMAHPQVFSGSRARFPTDATAVARIASILSSVRLSDTPNDIKGGAYEEVLRNTFEKNENQQYFTPRHVVDFMVEMCAPKDHDRTCDPASGSGGFLVGALNYVEKHGGNVTNYGANMRGGEIDERMAWIARINVLMHGGDPKSIYHLRGAGSLAPLNLLRSSLPHKSFDLILTNPPFGSDMTDAETLGIFATGKGRSSRRRGVLFVERCLHLLKPGGQLAIVLDDSVLNLPSNDDIRELIREQAIVTAVISLPDVTFMPYSTAKSSILFLRKRESANDRQGLVFMADVENVGNRPNGDPLYADDYDEHGNRLLLSELPEVLLAYQRHQRGDEVLEYIRRTTVFSADINAYAGTEGDTRLDVYFYHPARRQAQYTLSRTRYPLKQLNDLVEVDGRSVNPTVEYGDDTVAWIGLGDIEANTGKFEIKEQRGDRVKSNAHLYQPNDILFSRLRPKLRKIIHIEPEGEPGICSSEILVLRIRREYTDKVLPGFLVSLLRSDLVYGQLIYQITGIGRPRVSPSAVKKVLIPIPPLNVQQRHLDNILAAEERAENMRWQAQQLLHEAGHDVGSAFTFMIRDLFPDGQDGSISSGVGSEADVAGRASM